MMWAWTFLFVVGVVAVAGDRPKSCAVGTQYKKDCNTCTCAADGKDKCSNINCNRPQPTTGAPSKDRPGDCPSNPTPPSSDICQKRTEKSTCSEDKNCPQAKKCCANGCNIKICRNAIYRYND